MTELERKRYFLTEEEFSLCCAAAGVKQVLCFPGGRTDPPARETVTRTVVSLARRGLLTARDDGTFLLAQDLSQGLRQIRDSQAAALAYTAESETPCALLYGDGTCYTSLTPGMRAEEYVGLSLYGAEELPAWLEDVGMTLPGNLPDDLLAAVRADQLTPLEDGALQDYLEQQAWPKDGSHAARPLPEEIAGFVESRRTADQRLLGRVFLVRQPLFDRLTAGSPAGVTEEIYRADALAEIVRRMLEEEME